MSQLGTERSQGELEQTILRRFCETQTLFSLSTALPGSLQALTDAFVRRFKSDIQGTLITDSLVGDVQNPESNSLTKTPLDEETTLLLGEWKSRNPRLSTFHTPRKATYRKRVTHNGSELKPGNVSFSDSLVVVGTEEVWLAAEIVCVFDVEFYPKGRREVFTLLKVRYFEELVAGDISNDIYRKFNGMGRIVYVEGSGRRKEVVPISNAISHFAMTETVLPRIKRKHAHVLPLFRVSSKFSRHNILTQFAPCRPEDTRMSEVVMGPLTGVERGRKCVVKFGRALAGWLILYTSVYIHIPVLDLSHR